MNSKHHTCETRTGLGLVLFSALLTLGCERPLPDADKNPESGLDVQQTSPSQPSRKPLPQQLRRSGSRILVTQHHPHETNAVPAYFSGQQHLVSVWPDRVWSIRAQGRATYG